MCYDEIFLLVKIGSFLIDDVFDRFKLYLKEVNFESFMFCSLLVEIEKEMKVVF